MPVVMRDDVLAGVYKAVQKNVKRIPTRLVMPGEVLYRSIDPTSRYAHLAKPHKGMVLSKSALDGLLKPPPTSYSKNRYTGPACKDIEHDTLGNQKRISPTTGLYCSLQAQALVNEVMHYGGRPGHAAFDGRVILFMEVIRTMMVADLSPHNEAASAFLKIVESDVERKLLDNPLREKLMRPDDCSVARGLGLAVANCGFYAGLAAQTARDSERSEEERGDNLVIFGTSRRPLDTVRVRSVHFYERGADHPEVFPVSGT